MAYERWCNSDLQRRVMQLVEQGLSASAAGLQAGTTSRSGREIAEKVKLRAARDGYDPELGLNHPAPIGLTVPKVTVDRDEITGKVTRTWYRYAQDSEKLSPEEIAQQVINVFGGELPTVPALPPLDRSPTDVAVLYPISDLHVGMYASARETGEAWDLNLCHSITTKWMERAISESPDADLGIYLLNGDFFHYDSKTAITPRHRHNLDASGRAHEMVDLGLELIYYGIDRMLRKHEHVTLMVVSGNHDDYTMMLLARLLQDVYRNEPRVTIEGGPSLYYSIVFGRTHLGFHHGHANKNQKLPLQFAAQFRRDWGDTDFTYIFVGHTHDSQKLAFPGAHVEVLPTLAGRDAYAAGGGWIHRRENAAIYFHKRFGQIGRSIWTPSSVM